MVKEIIRLGNKVDIQMVQQAETEKNTGGARVRTYRSIVEDIQENGDIEIAMPLENGKVILLPLGVRFEFVFYTKRGLYRSVGVIKERYKRDNIFIILIELKTALGKFQRREYYRYPCLMELQYYIIGQKEAKLENTNEIYQKIQEKNEMENQKCGSIVDISGGGMRFISDEKNEIDAYLLVLVRLCNEKMDNQYRICGHVLSSELYENQKDKYENRVQFVFRDDSIREEIIRYIFEEERKTYSKNKG